MDTDDFRALLPALLLVFFCIANLINSNKD